MAEESVDVPVIPGATMSHGVELRRHSSGRASSGNDKEKVVPQYLRASTGSCHDFCKYGARKHVVEAKEERLSIPKRAERKPRHHSLENINGGIMTSFTKLRASADSEPTKIPRRRQSVDSVLHISVEKSSEGQKHIGNEAVVNKNITPLVKVKSSLLQNSHVSSIHRRQEISSSFKVETPLMLTSKRVEPTLKSTSERVKTHQKAASQMVKASSKHISKTAKTSSEFAEKYVISLNPDSIATKKVSSKNSSGNSGGQRNSEIKKEKKKASCKVTSPLRASFPSKPLKSIASINAKMRRSLKIVSSLKNQPKPRKVEAEEHNNEAQEKTLYVIKVESEKQTLQSDQNTSQDIELSLPHSLSSHKLSSSSISKLSPQEDQEESESESQTSEYVETLEVEENGKPQKDGIVPGFEGKLVETMTEKSSLMRLKFRRGIVLVGNATDIHADADNIDGVSVTEKVVLRHQDMQDKKDGLVLFNNVIEETASKLVETQKSKVKALVGAFETVISLQEKKPVANSVN